MFSSKKKAEYEKSHHNDVIRILKKRNKTMGDLKVLGTRFEKINFFASFKGKIDDESFNKLLKNLTFQKLKPNQL